jgi:hypothetical protein
MRDLIKRRELLKRAVLSAGGLALSGCATTRKKGTIIAGGS